MERGAAILDFGDEFGPNAVEKTMRNDGPNLADNNLSGNKSTSCVKQQDDDRLNDNDDTRIIGSNVRGVKETNEYGLGD